MQICLRINGIQYLCRTGIKNIAKNQELKWGGESRAQSSENIHSKPLSAE